MPEKGDTDDLRERIHKRLGGSLAKRPPLEWLAMLQKNADALGIDWHGKDDGTLVRKVFGPPHRRQG